MLPTTSTFKTAVRQSYQAITKAEVRSPSGNLLMTLKMGAGLDKGGVSLKAGQVDLDGENNVRRKANIDILVDPNNSVVPANYSDILAPFANEIWIYRGIQYPTAITLLDGNISNQEFVLIGVFRISGFDAKQSNAGIGMTIQGEDRSSFISRNTWQAPYQLPSAELSVALKSMISNRYPAVTFNFTPTTFTIGNIIFGSTIGGDPWADAVTLANLCGQDLYFDANGICVLKPLPILSNSVPITTQIQGQAGFSLISAQRVVQNKDVFNNIILNVQPSDGSTPYTVIASDQDPTSPTNINGSFGVVTKVINTSVPTSTTQATTVARALLNQYIGRQDTYNLSMVADPSIDVYDIMQVTVPGIKANSNVIIDTAVIPLDVSTPMNLTCRVIIGRQTVVV